MTLLLFPKYRTHYPSQKERSSAESHVVLSCFPPTCSLLTLLLAHIVCNQHTPWEEIFLYAHMMPRNGTGWLCDRRFNVRNIGFFWRFDVENLASRRLGGGSLCVCSEGGRACRNFYVRKGYFSFYCHFIRGRMLFE